MARARNPHQPNTEARRHIDLPVGSTEALFKLIGTLDHRNLPAKIALSDLAAITDSPQQFLFNMRFLVLLTNEQQPTGLLQLLVAKYGNDQYLWQRELWQIVCTAYSHALGAVHPIVASEFELELQFSRASGWDYKRVKLATEFFMALRKEAGLDQISNRVAWAASKEPPAVEDHPPGGKAHSHPVAKSPSELAITVPLHNGRQATLSLPAECTREDLTVLEAAINMLSKSRP